MKVKLYKSLPDAAMQIRTEVFVVEQGFVDSPDEVDNIALHFVAYDAERAIATCRIFQDGKRGYILGRFAVIKSYRNKGVGSYLLDEVCRALKDMRAPYIKLHSQYTAKDFYQKNGFIECAEPEYEQNALHVWMMRTL